MYYYITFPFLIPLDLSLYPQIFPPVIDAFYSSTSLCDSQLDISTFQAIFPILKAVCVVKPVHHYLEKALCILSLHIDQQLPFHPLVLEALLIALDQAPRATPSPRHLLLKTARHIDTKHLNECLSVLFGVHGILSDSKIVRTTVLDVILVLPGLENALQLSEAING